MRTSSGQLSYHKPPSSGQERTNRKRQRLRGICHQMSSCVELTLPRCSQETLESVPTPLLVHSPTMPAITSRFRGTAPHTFTPLVRRYLRRLCSYFLTYGDKRTVYLKCQLPHRCRIPP